MELMTFQGHMKKPSAKRAQDFAINPSTGILEIRRSQNKKLQQKAELWVRFVAGNQLDNAGKIVAVLAKHVRAQLTSN